MKNIIFTIAIALVIISTLASLCLVVFISMEPSTRLAEYKIYVLTSMTATVISYGTCNIIVKSE